MVLYIRRKDGKVLWMVYRDRNGKRVRESTYTDDWQEAQRKLRERLQSRDDRVLEVVRKGEKLQFSDWVDFFLENYSRPPIRAEKTHAGQRAVGKHLKAAFGQRQLLISPRTISSTIFDGGFRPSSDQDRCRGFQKGRLKPATVHQELRVLRRMLNVAVRKRLFPANPCWGVEFPVKVKDCSGRTTCRGRSSSGSSSGACVFAQHHPDHHRNRTQGVQGTDADEKGASGSGERNGLDSGFEDAKRDRRSSAYGIWRSKRFGTRFESAGPGTWLFPSDENPTGHQKTSEDGLACGVAQSKGAVFPAL